MAVLIYIEKKTFFSYWNQEISVRCGFYLVGPPKSLPKAHIQGMELEGNINSLCQVECSTRESRHHGLITNNTINELYKILYVTISCTYVPQYCIIYPSTGTRLELGILFAYISRL